jgi:hypothetical protein
VPARRAFPIRSSSSRTESVKILRDEERWYWCYFNEKADLVLRSNDDFDTVDDAYRSASIAYPRLDPLVAETDPATPAPQRLPRGPEARRLAAVAVVATAAAAIARWRGRASNDR